MIKEFLAKLAARKVAKQLDLKEGTPMENSKPWYKSKTILSDIVTILVSIYELSRTGLADHLGHPLPPIPEFVFVVLGAIGIYGRKTATTEIKPA